MKQNFTYKGLTRLYFIMRVSLVNLILLVTPCLQVLSANPANGQNVHDAFVNIDVEHVSLKRVIKIIEDQTDFLFVYSPDLIEAYSDVNLNVHASVYEVLGRLLKDVPVTFKESESNILLFKKSGAEYPEKTAQPINGKVVDASTGTGLPGVSVVIRGTTNGTTTDADGRFAIDARTDDILIFSSVGFKNQEISVSGRSTIDVQMEEDVASLNEVEINGGYYTTTSETKTGNIVKILGKEIRDQPVTSPLLSIQGRAAGVDVSPNSGVPGGGINVKIRGQGNFRYNGAYPLYVVDGVPLDPTPMQSGSVMLAGGYDPLSALNPADIESIEVLKDADATAIYGSRGANGVVLITTKRSIVGRTSTEFNMYRGIGQIPRKLELLNTKEYLELRREAFRNNNNEVMTESTAPDFMVWDTTRNTDWQDRLIGGTADISDLQASISGGNSTTSFRLGGGYHKETTVFPGDFYFQRITGSLSLSHLSRNNKFRATVSANYGASKTFFFNGQSPVLDALTLPPNAPKIYNEDGGLNWEMNSLGASTWVNPLAGYKCTNDAKGGNLLFNGTLSYNLVSGLMLKANIGFNDLGSTEILRIPLNSYAPDQSIYFTSESTFSSTSRKSWIVEPQILFSKRLGMHGLDFVLGTTFQKGVTDNKQFNGSGYPSDALLNNLQGASVVRILKDDNSEYRYTAMFARIGYDWKERYYLNITGRRDGSSRFGADNRFGGFGSIGAAWIFSRESFIVNNLPFLSFGKIRSSIGTTGNDQIGDYRYMNTYSVTSVKYQNVYGLRPTNLYNPEYKWEVTKKLEAALELSVIKNRISVEIAWYRNRSSNQLIDYLLPGTSGLGSVLRNLDATVENSGLEYTFNVSLVDKEDFSWTASFNYSRPRNKLIKFSDIQNSPYSDTYIVGKSLSVTKLYRYTGVDPESGVYTFVDADSNDVMDNFDRISVAEIGRSNFGGINNTIRFKRLELSFLLQFVKNTSLRPSVSSLPGLMINLPKDIYDARWQQPGDVTDVEKVSTDYGMFLPFIYNGESDNNIESSSFMRLKTISLSYSLPLSLLNKLRLQQCKLYFQGQNLFTITDFSGLDPETGSFVAPPLRVFSLGVRVGI